MIEALLIDGRVALIAAAIMAVELILARRIGGRRAAAFAANSCAGIALAIALWAALAGAGSFPVLLALGLSFVAHLAYLALTLSDRQ